MVAQTLNDLRRDNYRQTDEADEVAYAAGRADGGCMDRFWIKLDKKIVWKQRLSAFCALAPDNFLQSDHRRQTGYDLPFKMFFSTQ